MDDDNDEVWNRSSVYSVISRYKDTSSGVLLWFFYPHRYINALRVLHRIPITASCPFAQTPRGSARANKGQISTLGIKISIHMYFFLLLFFFSFLSSFSPFTYFHTVHARTTVSRWIILWTQGTRVLCDLHQQERMKKKLSYPSEWAESILSDNWQTWAPSPHAQLETTSSTNFFTFSSCTYVVCNKKQCNKWNWTWITMEIPVLDVPEDKKTKKFLRIYAEFDGCN